MKAKEIGSIIILEGSHAEMEMLREVLMKYARTNPNAYDVDSVREWIQTLDHPKK